MGEHHGTSHKHGEMDISTQEKTFDGFMNWSTKTAIAIVVTLVLLALFTI
jgi:hypothetical protein